MTDDFVVVGAGPVGLTAALAAAKAGRDVTVLEAEHKPATEWRASTFHAPTLEMCTELGVVDRMLDLGLKAPKYQIRDRHSGVIAEFDMKVLSEDTPFPYRLQLEQYKYVEILLEALSAQPQVKVRFGHPVEDLVVDQSSGQVTYRVGEQTQAAALVLGADGASSAVRKSLDIPFEGSTYEHRYLLLSVDGPVEDLLPDIEFVNYVADPAEHLMILRIPDLWRIMFEVKPGTPDEEVLADDYVGAVLDRLHPGLRDMANPSRQLYRVHQRVAARFKEGGALLAGDAAHVNSPLGGMGLNSGIHDAVDLGRVLAEGGDDSELAAWAQRRRRVALEEIQRITHSNTATLTEVRGAQASRNHTLLGEIAADPIRSREYLLEASMLANARRHSMR